MNFLILTMENLQSFSFSTSIFIGVLSGLLTAILIFALSKFIKKVLIPWYQNVVFRGLDVSGNWISEFSFNNQVISEQVLELEQKGHWLNGQMSSTYKLRNPNITVSFSIEGEIFDNYVFLRYKPTNKKHLGGGSVMLKIVEGGAIMEGGLVAIDRFSSNIIVSQNSKWKREI